MCMTEICNSALPSNLWITYLTALFEDNIACVAQMKEGYIKVTEPNTYPKFLLIQPKLENDK